MQARGEIRVENENKKGINTCPKKKKNYANEIQVQYTCLCDEEAKKILLTFHFSCNHFLECK